MVSKSTLYRQARINILKKISNDLIELYLLDKQQLERVPLWFLKNIEKQLRFKLDWAINPERESTGGYISQNGHDGAGDTPIKKRFTKKGEKT